MTSTRDIEVSVVGQCRFEAGSVVLPKDADDEVPVIDLVAPIPPPGADDNNQSDSNLDEKPQDPRRLSCVYSASNHVIRLKPMARVHKQKDSPLWQTDLHFHDRLDLTTLGSSNQENSSATLAFCVIFEARSREGVAVALSPGKKFVKGNTYEIILGDRGNTLVTLRRQSNNDKKTDEASKTNALQVQRPARVCTERSWTCFWITLWHGKVHVGVGQKVGHRCIAMLDDISRQDQPPTEDQRVRFVGLGNAGVGDRGETAADAFVRNVILMPVSNEVETHLQAIKEGDMEFVDLGGEDMDEETRNLLREYNEECKKARTRAEKFGIPYKEPPTFIPWSQVRRLRANPKQGFATGIDLSAPEEKRKLEERKRRFQTQESSEEGKEQEVQETTAKPTSNANDIPVEQAWDNAGGVHSHRVDPPPSIWKEEVATSAEGMLTPEKVHIFSIDWAAFKQIRTTDIMKHFSIYGPSYVEWLGDLSCNVHFQDRFSAARALEHLATEIPSPPPNNVDVNGNNKRDDLGQMGWRMGKSTVLKLTNDKHGRRGTKARVLMRLATSSDVLQERPSSWPKPPTGFSTKKVLGPSKTNSQNKTKPKARNRGGKRNRDPTKSPNPENNGPGLLDRGLTAARSGFSLEEIERERQQKRLKQSG